jgi:hypothetical protein
MKHLVSNIRVIHAVHNVSTPMLDVFHLGWALNLRSNVKVSGCIPASVIRALDY